MDYFDVQDVNDIPGTMPADTAVWLTGDYPCAGLYWGIRTNPAAGFLPVQDYQGTGTANAASGETSDLSMTGALATVGTPASLDVDAFRSPSGRAGRYAVLARFLQDATTPASTSVRAVSSLTADVGADIDVSSLPIRASAPIPVAGFETADLGRVAIPAISTPNAQVYGSPTAAVKVQASCSESSKTFKLDGVCLIPVDEGAVLYTGAAVLEATQGLVSDAMSPVLPVSPYLCDADGYTGAFVGGYGCEVLGNPRLRPGDQQLVVAAYGPPDTDPTPLTIRVDYVPVWRTPLEA